MQPFSKLKKKQWGDERKKAHTHTWTQGNIYLKQYAKFPFILYFVYLVCINFIEHQKISIQLSVTIYILKM